MSPSRQKAKSSSSNGYDFKILGEHLKNERDQRRFLKAQWVCYVLCIRVIRHKQNTRLGSPRSVYAERDLIFFRIRKITKCLWFYFPDIILRAYTSYHRPSANSRFSVLLDTYGLLNIKTPLGHWGC